MVAGGGRLPVRRAGVGAVPDRAGGGPGAGGRRRGALLDGGRRSRRSRASRRDAARGRAGVGGPGGVGAAHAVGLCAGRRLRLGDAWSDACGFGVVGRSAGGRPRRSAAAARGRPCPPRPGGRRRGAGDRRGGGAGSGPAGGTASAGPSRRPTGCGRSGVELGHVAEGVGEGVEDLVRFARLANPADPYNLNHPGRFVANASTALAGAVGRRRASRAPGGGVRRARVGLRPGAGVRPPAAHRSADGGRRVRAARPSGRPGPRTAPAALGAAEPAPLWTDPRPTARPVHARSTTPRRPARCTSTACGSTRSGSALRPIRAAARGRVTASVGTGSARSPMGSHRRRPLRPLTVRRLIHFPPRRPHLRPVRQRVGVADEASASATSAPAATGSAATGSSRSAQAAGAVAAADGAAAGRLAEIARRLPSDPAKLMPKDVAEPGPHHDPERARRARVTRADKDFTSTPGQPGQPQVAPRRARAPRPREPGGRRRRSSSTSSAARSRDQGRQPVLLVHRAGRPRGGRLRRLRDRGRRRPAAGRHRRRPRARTSRSSRRTASRPRSRPTPTASRADRSTSTCGRAASRRPRGRTVSTPRRRPRCGSE